MKRMIIVFLAVLVLTSQIVYAKEWYKEYTVPCEDIGALEAGKYEPGAFINRGEIASLLNRVRKAFNIDIIKVQEKSFIDINEINKSGNKEDIQELADSEKISGYQDGSFLPKKTVTRAEFAKLINSVFFNEEVSMTLPFEDVAASSWYYNHVCVIYSKSIIDGYRDENILKFKPNNLITFAEAAKITLLAAKKASPIKPLVQTAVTPLPEAAPNLQAMVTPGTAVRFSDINLEKAIKAFLNKGENDVITEDEAGKVEVLSLRSCEISNLSGLGYFNNLKSLDIGINNVGDISEVSCLKKLSFINFDKNRVSDISAFGSLENLDYFSAENNLITDIKPLTSNKKLTKLYIKGNGVADISVLASFPGLDALDISFNGIRDINALSELKKLTLLYMIHNNITDLSPLKELPLKMLFIENNPIKDFTPVKDKDFKTTDIMR